MSGTALTYLGSTTVFCWGVAHLIPTRNVVADFGEISLDIRRTLAMEWITEGVALIFVGFLIALVTVVDQARALPPFIWSRVTNGMKYLSGQPRPPDLTPNQRA